MYLIKGDEKVLHLIDQKTVAINFIIEIELLGWQFMNDELQKVIEDIIKDVLYFAIVIGSKKEQLVLGKSIIS